MITINILRVSSDGQYLEMNVECPENYVFNRLLITRYNPTTKQDEPTLDFSATLTGSTTNEIIRINTSLLGSDITMYTVELSATSGDPEGVLSKTGICSNVNFVYAALLDFIVKSSSCCLSCNDYEIIDRNTLILYAHKEAMRLDRYAEATYFYDIIWKLFSKCGQYSARPL